MHLVQGRAKKKSCPKRSLKMALKNRDLSTCKNKPTKHTPHNRPFCSVDGTEG